MLERPYEGACAECSCAVPRLKPWVKGVWLAAKAAVWERGRGWFVRRVLGIHAGSYARVSQSGRDAMLASPGQPGIVPGGQLLRFRPCRCYHLQVFVQP